MVKNTKRMLTAAIIGGVGIASYMYMKKNPELMMQMKNLTKDAAKKAYDKLEDIE